MNIDIILLLIWLHFIGDFLFQSNWMALNKSNNIIALSYHCAFYAIPFMVISLEYALLMGMLHFPVDFITSKITSRYYKNQRIFFLVIGFDQAVHMTILIMAYEGIYL